MPEPSFGEWIATRHETLFPESHEPVGVQAVVDALAELAAGGAALELGGGTGRIALPLSARGVAVHGIDLSPEMLAELRAHPGAERVGVTLGDFATTKVEGAFSLAYVVWNTITNLTSQDEQVACFQNVADHLERGGRFLIEVFVPDLQRLPPGETARVGTLTPTHVCIDEYDVANQRLVSNHYWLLDGRIETSSAPFRYVWPHELDLMARLAGMRLEQRWGGWDRAPFTSDSRGHVSIWIKD